MTKKIYHFIVVLLAVSSSSFAQQWAGSTTTTNAIYRDGNVGIGTTAPLSPLHVVTTAEEISVFKNSTAINARIAVANTTGQVNLGIGNATPHAYIWSNTGKFFIGNDGGPTFCVSGMSNGNVGIGTMDPTSPLTVVSNSNGLAYFKSNNANNTAISVANTTGQVNLGIGQITQHAYIWSNTNSLFIGNDGDPTLFINGMGNGNVGIGTTNTGSFKLAVEGKIGAREIRVTNANPWPDYVFNNRYKLRSLSSLEDYVKKNNRLPNMPSAEEVKDNGIELGQMNTRVVQNIEELTLYVIALNKNMLAMNKKIEALEKDNASLRKQLKK